MKKLLLLLTVGFIISCSNERLEIEPKLTLENLKEYVLPPKLNTTPINQINHINNNLDGLQPPPPRGWCYYYPEDCQLWDTLVFNGSDKINVVFTADGWTVFGTGDEFGVTGYNKRVDSLITGLLSYEPFASNVNEFNFFTYRTFVYTCEENNCDEGITVLSHETNNEIEDIKLTYWNVYRNFAGLPRYTHLPDDKREQLYNDLIKAPHGYLKNKQVYVVILSSGETFAGSGEFPKMYGNNQKMSITILTKSTEPPFAGLMVKLFVHEFAHAFGEQDDEYVDNNYASLAPIYDPIVWNYPDRLNVTRDTINDQKWDPSNYTDTGNKFWESARYLSTGVFKSTAGLETCNCGYMMERIDRPFSELNIELIKNIIDNH